MSSAASLAEGLLNTFAAPGLASDTGKFKELPARVLKPKRNAGIAGICFIILSNS